MAIYSQNITQLLHQYRDDKSRLVDAVYPLVYEHLRKEAHLQLRREQAGHTLQTTSLVHEAYLKMVDQEKANFNNRTHFLAVAALAMRRILVSHARKKKAQKRGGDKHTVTFEDGSAPFEASTDDLLHLDELLEKLEKMDERQANIVQYRFFGGLTYKEIANIVGGTEHSVRYDWRVARAWLKRELG